MVVVMGRMGNEGFASLVKRWLVSGLGVWLGSLMVDGIGYDDKTTLVVVVLLLGLFMAVLRPLLILLALPFVVLTLGVGLLFINALVYLLVGNLVDGFTVDGFGAAFWGALIISLLNLVFSGWIGSGAKVRVRGNVGPRGSSSRTRRVRRAGDDVIDI